MERITRVLIAAHTRMTTPHPTTYFLYARKSLEAEDRQVASIDAQITALREVATAEGLHIVEVLSEARSAKSPGRPVFTTMLKRIRAGEAQGIIAWKLDRLARNPIDGGEISWMLQQGTIQHIRTHDRHYYPADNVLMMAVELGMANQYIRELAQNIRRGLKQKCEHGWRPGVAPLGYRNSKSAEQGRNTILVDPERFPLVRKIFEAVLSGLPVPRVYEKVREEWKLTNPAGKIISKSTLYLMLQNSFYFGEFEYPVESGLWYRGSHQAMISREEYERIQVVLGKSGRTRRGKRRRFAFTGLIRCGECGAMVTAEEKIKRQKNGTVHLYVYYHCTKRKTRCAQRVIQEHDLEAQILAMLDSITIPPAFHQWAMESLRTEIAAENVQETRAAHETALAACVEKIDALIDMRAAGEITEEELARRKAALTREKLRLEGLLVLADHDRSLERAEQHFSFAETARATFEAGDFDEKRRIFIDLGSNPILMDRTLDLTMENVLGPLREAADEVRTIHRTFEPHESVGNKEGFGYFYARSPILCWGSESNRRPSPLQGDALPTELPQQGR